MPCLHDCSYFPQLIGAVLVSFLLALLVIAQGRAVHVRMHIHQQENMLRRHQLHSQLLQMSAVYVFAIEPLERFFRNLSTYPIGWFAKSFDCVTIIAERIGTMLIVKGAANKRKWIRVLLGHDEGFCGAFKEINTDPSRQCPLLP